MNNIKKYVIVLEPRDSDCEIIEKFRLEKIGQRLVDNLPPHVTFKTGFFINKNSSQEDIVNAIESFNLSAQKITFNRVEKFGDAVVLVVEGNDLKEYHKDFLNLIDSNVISVKPEFEGDNFKPHMSLYRDSSYKKDESNLIVKEVILNKISLYEIDPTPNRGFVNLIYTKNLE